MPHLTPLLLAITLLTHFVSPHLTQAPPTLEPPSESNSYPAPAFQSDNLDEQTKQALRISFLSRNDEQSSFISQGKPEKIENNVNQIKQLMFSFKNSVRKNKRVRISPPQASQSNLNNELQEEIIIKNYLQNAIYLDNQIKHQQVSKAIKMRQFIQRSAIESHSQAEKEYLYYEQKYNISQYNQLPICVVIPTYNNAKGLRHIRNIKSIVNQNYSNYHIVVFDDASTDGTGQDILQFLQEESDLPAEKYHIIVNDRQMKAMFNLRRAAMQICKPEELFMIVDGDDELIGRNVFKLYSALFQAQDAWFVYSNFLHGENNVGFSRPYPEHIVEKNNYRFYPLVASHLRVFYTKLFQNLKESDLQDERGEYYKAANDVAICVPILQQAYKRVRYIAQITYYYNINTGQNNHILRKKEQKRNDRRIRRKNKYVPLEALLA